MMIMQSPYGMMQVGQVGQVHMPQFVPMLIPQVAQLPPVDNCEASAAQTPTPPPTENKKASTLGPSPCEHNDWDSVRTVSGMFTLRCRVCHAQRKEKLCKSDRCTDFIRSRVCNGKCAKLHIHSKKLSVSQRLGFDKITPCTQTPTPTDGGSDIFTSDELAALVGQVLNSNAAQE
eukprot:TRINITY_DN3189_c0_g1_i1.p1 TRINITY_DN3189_c0_g1~~TRINITY_DN3189_c0_g1_i1.p1  ORF type:complete len:175 (+),score=35.52 TRINITY_DN3189_c0_g1_i1:68-592(+)